MVPPTPPEQRRELGDFVRSLREKLKPQEVGLPGSARRRTPGLRREEAAQLCGLSVTWYTWLEQGRNMSISAAALARLVSGFRLGRAERAYLFELAARRDPEHSESQTAVVSPPILACVDLIAAPAYVLDRTWTARSWNVRAEHLFVGWLDGTADRNLLRFIFLEPSARSLIHDYAHRARRVVAEFRADVCAHLNDPAIHRLVEALNERSEAFKQYWHERVVLGREGGERTFDHPAKGFLRYEQVTFAVAGQPDLKLTILLQS
jgi:transcriptional regulator with XRE-family HTH domain